MGLFARMGGVGTSILRERPTRLISARLSCQEPHDPQQLGTLPSVTWRYRHVGSTTQLCDPPETRQNNTLKTERAEQWWIR
ncbi:hypothetical protein MICRO11B_290063 [Micrococcus luteus]|nr:hypothetical protein MICRO11B_290063 [Micrococcus luteus]